MDATSVGGSEVVLDKQEVELLSLLASVNHVKLVVTRFWFPGEVEH